MWDILPGTLYHWYRDHLSDYHAEKATGAWPGNRLITADEETGEVLEEKPIYIFKPSNIGERMSIDDKAIGDEGYTIMSNTDTGKIAMLEKAPAGKNWKKRCNSLATSCQK